jgi:hypothetical protein
MDRHVSVFDTAPAIPVGGNAAYTHDDSSTLTTIAAIVIILLMLWFVVFAVGYAAEACSWLADTLRARRENSRR